MSISPRSSIDHVLLLHLIPNLKLPDPAIMKFLSAALALALATTTSWAQETSPEPDVAKHHCVVLVVTAGHPSIITQGFCQDHLALDAPSSQLYTKLECEAMRDPIVSGLVASYGQHNIGRGKRCVPEYGFAQEEFKGTKAWVTIMHAQMVIVLRQSKEEGVYPECTGGRNLYANSNRLCLMEHVPLCQYAWEDDVFKRTNSKNTPTWE
ncbi:hypothetical protein BDV19DRAFT_394807 [Aspergillus venezuelensis]